MAYTRTKRTKKSKLRGNKGGKISAEEYIMVRVNKGQKGGSGKNRKTKSRFKAHAAKNEENKKKSHENQWKERPMLRKCRNSVL